MGPALFKGLPRAHLLCFVAPLARVPAACAAGTAPSAAAVGVLVARLPSVGALALADAIGALEGAALQHRDTGMMQVARLLQCVIMTGVVCACVLQSACMLAPGEAGQCRGQALPA